MTTGRNSTTMIRCAWLNAWWNTTRRNTADTRTASVNRRKQECQCHAGLHIRTQVRLFLSQRKGESWEPGLPGLNLRKTRFLHECRLIPNAALPLASGTSEVES